MATYFVYEVSIDAFYELVGGGGGGGVYFVSKIISWSFICHLYCNYLALESVILANVICQPLNRLRILACFEPATTH